MAFVLFSISPRAILFGPWYSGSPYGCLRAFIELRSRSGINVRQTPVRTPLHIRQLDRQPYLASWNAVVVAVSLFRRGETAGRPSCCPGGASRRGPSFPDHVACAPEHLVSPVLLYASLRRASRTRLCLLAENRRDRLGAHIRSLSGIASASVRAACGSMYELTSPSRRVSSYSCGHISEVASWHGQDRVAVYNGFMTCHWTNLVGPDSAE